MSRIETFINSNFNRKGDKVDRTTGKIWQIPRKGLDMKNHIKTIKKDDFIVLLFQLICMHNPND